MAGVQRKQYSAVLDEFSESRMTKLLICSALIAWTIASVAGAAPTAPRTFTNPLLPSGPDPWIVRDGTTYYYMNTLGDRLAIRKTLDLARLADAPEITVWTPPAKGRNAQSIWAPELHLIDGKWYIYYTAAENGHDDDAHRGIFVLENAGADPTRGAWTDRGRLKTEHNGIDGTTFAYAGKRYFVYSPYAGPDSVLAIVAMTDPWTLSGKETIIARPDLDWERQGGRQILEGPEFLLGPKGDLFLTYSASACWSDNYAIGQLRANAASNPLDSAAWTKSARPVVANAPDQNVYAPGHNGFFTSPSGSETWIVYHANPAPGLKCTPMRSPRIQRVTWTTDGVPVFARPVGSATRLAAPAR
jgi:GH43 family beta-xylosidase